jgi:hypothetical protein
MPAQRLSSQYATASEREAYILTQGLFDFGPGDLLKLSGRFAGASAFSSFCKSDFGRFARG